jgi:hypothetical protein
MKSFHDYTESNRSPSDTDHALYFHDRTVKPDWATQYIKTVDIGSFLFYKQYDDSVKR